MSKSYFEADDRITYPEADEIAAAYLDAKGAQRSTVTSRAVLDWADVDDSTANQKRIHDALSLLCEATKKDWAGRTVFKVPDDSGDNQ